MVLTGGADTPGARAALHDVAGVPADIVPCFDEVTTFPVTESLSRREAVKLIVDLRKSEIKKTQCGQRLIAWYEAL